MYIDTQPQALWKESESHNDFTTWDLPFFTSPIHGDITLRVTWWKEWRAGAVNVVCNGHHVRYLNPDPQSYTSPDELKDKAIEEMRKILFEEQRVIMGLLPDTKEDII